MNSPKVKLCGLTTPEAVDAATAHGAAYAGFIFFEASPRHLTLEKVAALRNLLPETVKAVAVTVDADDAELTAIVSAMRPDLLQLHGAESPERVRHLRETFGSPIIKAIGVKDAAELDAANAFTDSADMLLFDTMSGDPKLPGGTGRSFDWSLLKGKTFSLPWFLSGGLGVENIAEAVARSGARMVDVSSSLEKEKGVKDVERIKAFMEKVKTI